MRFKKKGIFLAAGLLAGAAALTGCSAQVTPVVTPTPDTAQKITAQPATAAPDAGESTPEPSASAAAEETPGPIALHVSGEELATDALEEEDMLLLPLIETAEVLGWSAEEENVEEETQTKRSVVLTKDESRISVSWVVSDNTTRQITWQKDGLLIPVDTRITTREDVVYVPAAFFEEAMGVSVSRKENAVSVTTPIPEQTPETDAQEE